MEATITWPGWDVVRKIGSGSFGNVYEIQRNMFGNVEKAALKVISIPRSQDEVEDFRSQGYTDEDITGHYQQCLQQIVQEYSLMAMIKGHSNVVSCEDVQYVEQESGIGWTILIKMELLTPMMKRLDKVTTEEQVVKLGMDLCNALVLCKERNIIHRDIKPQNIFISDTGSFKLGDFGIAKTVERTSGGTRVGTYKYMAPEVYNNYPYGHAADIYSLGLVLYWLLNEKRTPFLPMPPQMPTATMEEQAGLRRFRGEAIPAPKYGSAGLKRIVLKACAYASADRYTSAAEMLRDLQVLQNVGAVQVADPTIPVATGYPTAGSSSRPQQPVYRSGAQSVRPVAPPVQPRPVAPVVRPVQPRPVVPIARPVQPPTFVPVAPPVQPQPAVKKKPAQKSKKSLLIVLIIAGILATAGIIIALAMQAENPNYDKPERAIDAYVDVVCYGNTSREEDLAPQEYFDYLEQTYGMDEESVISTLDQYYVRFYEDHIEKCGANISTTYEVTEQKALSDKRYDKIVNSLERAYAISDSRVGNAYTLDVEITVKGDYGKESYDLTFVSIEIDNQWYWVEYDSYSDRATFTNIFN